MKSLARITNCSDFNKVDHLIENEPSNFYDIIYNILEEDYKIYDLNSFKHFYAIRRLPLYGTRVFDEEIKLVESFIENSSDDIKNRLLNGLEETRCGHADEERFSSCVFNITNHNIKTCAIITRNATHLIQAFRKKIDVKDFDTILEFGGGYGGMAKLCSDMGYKNTYYIYDLPAIKKIQKYYLDALEINHKIINDYTKLKKINTTGKKLFIATWSLSEVDFDLRSKILDIIKDFDAVIIAYQGSLWDRNNKKYFEEKGVFQNNFKKIKNWSTINIPYIKWDGGSFHLLGY